MFASRVRFYNILSHLKIVRLLSFKAANCFVLRDNIRRLIKISDLDVCTRTISSSFPDYYNPTHARKEKNHILEKGDAMLMKQY